MCVYCMNKIEMGGRFLRGKYTLWHTINKSYFCNSITWDKMFGAWPSAHHYHGWRNCLFFIGPRYPASNDQTNIGRHKKVEKPEEKKNRNISPGGWEVCNCPWVAASGMFAFSANCRNGLEYRLENRRTPPWECWAGIKHICPKSIIGSGPQISIDAFNDNHVGHKLCTECSCFTSPNGWNVNFWLYDKRAT